MLREDLTPEHPRVLIIEEPDEVGYELDMALTAAGFDARVVPGGDAALEQVDGWHPSAILVDLRLHDRLGHRFCAALARRPDDAHRPVVLIGEAPNLLKRTPITPAALVPTPIDEMLLVGAIRRVTGEPLY